MSLYLETSCLLKLVLDEPDSPAVEAALEGEVDIIVSTLTQLEATNVLLAMRFGGELSKREHAVTVQALGLLIGGAPFHLVPVPADAFDLALLQLEPGKSYCRTLDRLHLAVAEGLGLKQFMTNDRAQAAAARALGFKTLTPR